MEFLTPDRIISELEDKAIFPFRILSPTLGAIIKENPPADEIYYLNSLKKKAEKYGAIIQEYKVDSSAEAGQAILELRSNPRVCGIIILSDYGNANKGLREMIPVRLDIDCCSSKALGHLMTSDSPTGYRLAPCAPVAAYKYLEYENYDLAGKKIAVLGRSLRVGRPLGEILCQRNGTVCIYHSKSGEINLSDYDVVITAMGKPKTLNKEYWKDGIEKTKYIIDIGIANDENGNLSGDCDTQDFVDCDVKITPVPGGVGKLTVVILFSKLFFQAAAMNGDVLNE